MNTLLTLVVFVASTICFSTGFAQPLAACAGEMETAFDAGQRILTTEEQESLLMAAGAHVPELAAHRRIAGTHGVISAGNVTGYYGGVYFGPIPISERRADYLSMTIWGDIQRGWNFDHVTRHTCVLVGDHPTWLWLTEPVTETLAKDALRQLRSMVRNGTPSDDESWAGLITREELRNVRRFTYQFWTPSDVVVPGQVEPWYSGHYVLTAMSQGPGLREYDYFAAINFAVMEEGLKLIRVDRRCHGSV
jgi:hypothetical protein